MIPAASEPSLASLPEYPSPVGIHAFFWLKAAECALGVVILLTGVFNWPLPLDGLSIIITVVVFAELIPLLAWARDEGEPLTWTAVWATVAAVLLTHGPFSHLLFIGRDLVELIASLLLWGALSMLPSSRPRRLGLVFVLFAVLDFVNRVSALAIYGRPVMVFVLALIPQLLLLVLLRSIGWRSVGSRPPVAEAR